MEVPSTIEIHSRIDDIPVLRDRNIIKTLYLLAARVSEITDRASGKNEKALGAFMNYEETPFTFNAFAIDKNIQKQIKTDALVIKVRVAKRRKKTVYKLIALPLSETFEPWTKDLKEIIEMTGSLQVPLTRQRVFQICKEHLHVNPHWLRHARLTHLAAHYGFNQIELVIYAGWTFGGAFGQTGSMLDTYLHLDWRKYFPKLLKPL